MSKLTIKRTLSRARERQYLWLVISILKLLISLETGHFAVVRNKANRHFATSMCNAAVVLVTCRYQ